MALKRVLFFFFLFISLSEIFAGSAFAQQNQAGSSAIIATASAEQIEDRRVKIIKSYLESYNSPLADYAPIFVQEADKNTIDWRLLVSISGVESTFGQQIPSNSYNAWGWGIYGDNMIRFASWNEAITTISKELRERYINQWKAQDVYQIGRLYAASPTWATRVDGFMQKIDAFALKNPSSLPISL